ncbi:MAG: hypothetical protein RLZZ387_1601 [Chloroflexota bacterium]|jgi:uncharacterized protein YgbK (DUF1537 family)
MTPTRSTSETLAALPPEWPDDPLPAVRAHPGRRTVVALDDDPTGTQTVHGVPVLTRWEPSALRAELERRPSALYVLTNSRSLPTAAAVALAEEVGRSLVLAAEGLPIAVVSRSDSTLRGHFPAETDALAGALGGFDATVLAPAFIPGGRYTIGDIHYAAEGDALVPAGQTEFARDAAFGYRASDLRQWVEEKTGGRVPASSVASVGIDDIRRGGPARVATILQGLPRGAVCVVNAASDRDLAVAALGALEAEAGGRRLLYRTAASFVPALAGIAPRPLLGLEELNLPPGGGLIVVGSYVPKSSGQLTELLTLPGVVGIELDVAALLDPVARAGAIARAVGQAEESLARGADVAVYTSRALVTGADAAGSLAIGRRVSEALVELVRRVAVRPRYLLAKGGITSSDVATEGLGVRRAEVLGQLLPGVPVWRSGPESLHPDLVYVVFPGNVGGPRAVADAVLGLRGAP